MAEQQQPMVTFDENGRPFIILRDQGAQQRVRGLEAHKQHILAAKVVPRVFVSPFDLSLFVKRRIVFRLAFAILSRLKLAFPPFF